MLLGTSLLCLIWIQKQFFVSVLCLCSPGQAANLICNIVGRQRRGQAAVGSWQLAVDSRKSSPTVGQGLRPWPREPDIERQQQLHWDWPIWELVRPAIQFELATWRETYFKCNFNLMRSVKLPQTQTHECSVWAEAALGGRASPATCELHLFETSYNVALVSWLYPHSIQNTWMHCALLTLRVLPQHALYMGVCVCVRVSLHMTRTYLNLFAVNRKRQQVTQTWVTCGNKPNEVQQRQRQPERDSHFNLRRK